MALVRVHGSHPTRRGLLLHFLEPIVPLGLEDRREVRPVAEPDQEIRHVVVRLAVVQVGDRKTAVIVLDEG